jgi:hypothetical protein
MKLLTWNTNFCWKKGCLNWKKFVFELMQKDYDFILLQEINPFFVYDISYKTEDGPVFSFQYGNKNIYYHELSDVLLNERPNDVFWGTSIITSQNIRKIKNHFYDDMNKYIGLNYFGHTALMCYDFELQNGNIITIINYYKKADTCKAKYNEKGDCINYDVIYYYEDDFFTDISKIVKNKKMIIFTGDFNVTKRENYEYDIGGIIKRIESIGFKNITKNIGRTMAYDNQNDYIFINNDYINFVNIFDINKIPPPKYIDHYGIKCKIKI